MTLGMGDKRALANLITQSLIDKFHVWTTTDDQGVSVDEFELTNYIANKINEFFGRTCPNCYKEERVCSCDEDSARSRS